MLEAIDLIRKLDSGELKHLPANAPTEFVPMELRRALKDRSGNLSRNAWEMGLALAVKDAFRSGDLYLPQSKHHVSFWDLMLSDSRWGAARDRSYRELQQPQPDHVRSNLVGQFHQTTTEAAKRFALDSFAEIHDGRLKLRRDDTAPRPSESLLQKTINASLPQIRIEDLPMQVDQKTGFTRHFVPLPRHQSRPDNFYKGAYKC